MGHEVTLLGRESVLSRRRASITGLGLIRGCGTSRDRLHSGSILHIQPALGVFAVCVRGCVGVLVCPTDLFNSFQLKNLMFFFIIFFGRTSNL